MAHVYTTQDAFKEKDIVVVEEKSRAKELEGRHWRDRDHAGYAGKMGIVRSVDRAGVVELRVGVPGNRRGAGKDSYGMLDHSYWHNHESLAHVGNVGGALNGDFAVTREIAEQIQGYFTADGSTSPPSDINLGAMRTTAKAQKPPAARARQFGGAAGGGGGAAAAASGGGDCGVASISAAMAGISVGGGGGGAPPHAASAGWWRDLRPPTQGGGQIGAGARYQGLDRSTVHAAHKVSCEETKELYAGHSAADARDVRDRLHALGTANYRMSQPFTNTSVHRRIDQMLLDNFMGRVSGVRSFTYTTMAGESRAMGGESVSVTSDEIARRIEQKIDIAKQVGDATLVSYAYESASALNRSGQAAQIDLRVFNGVKRSAAPSGAGGSSAFKPAGVTSAGFVPSGGGGGGGAGAWSPSEMASHEQVFGFRPTPGGSDTFKETMRWHNMD
jgi:hypothetical protein